jgi:hypothetical protein
MNVSLSFGRFPMSIALEKIVVPYEIAIGGHWFLFGGGGLDKPVVLGTRGGPPHWVVFLVAACQSNMYMRLTLAPLLTRVAVARM